MEVVPFPNGFSIINSGDNTSSVDINISGTLDDSQVGTLDFSLVVDTNKSTTITQDFTLNVLEVNDKPINTSAVNDINISFGLTQNMTYSINDGDSNTEQNIDITATSNNSNVTVGTITNNQITNNGDIIIPLTGALVGSSTITVTLIDNGDTANGGDNVEEFSFTVYVRNSGWKIYDDNNISNPTTPIDFDNITYSWNSTNLWYESNTDNIILMPIKILSTADFKGTNLNKIADGHYNVLKNNYINDTQKTDIYNSGTSYTTASGGTKQVIDSEFNHDATHHLFVSRLVNDGDGLDTKSYSEFIGQSPSFIEIDSLNDTNTSYKIAGGFDGSYIDINNDGNSTKGNICAIRYGEGWRIATSHEMGKKDNIGDGTDEYYIPAYLGTANDYIWSSTRVESETTRVWVVEPGTAKWKTRTYDPAIDNNQYTSRCVYNNF